MSSRFMVAVTFCLAAPGTMAAEDILTLVREGHRSSVQAIDSFTCDVTQHWSGAGKFRTESGRYWRQGDVVRIQHRTDQASEDVVIQNGRMTGIYRRHIPNSPEQVSASITPSKQYTYCDVWLLALLAFYHPDHGAISFEELLHRSADTQATRHIDEDKRDLVRVSVTYDRARFDIQFDPEVNYLVRSVTVTMTDGAPAGASVVQHFREVRPGMYFPEEVATSWSDGVRVVTKFSAISLNQPLPPDALKLRFPPGIAMTDLIKGSLYKVDAEGRPVGPVTDSKGNLVTLAKDPPLPVGLDLGSPRGPTLDEPKSWTSWIIPVSLCMLAAAGCLWVLRLWRNRSQLGS